MGYLKAGNVDIGRADADPPIRKDDLGAPIINVAVARAYTAFEEMIAKHCAQVLNLALGHG